ncbi:FAD-dependent monooxygenase [Celerinatantimonas sp. YJH-8]|uniref:FAD-dependent monooxygenase n=1 Tax=Celerinatantimonas sp. YJH-8 TaxID=3228714 RepID=UPI0038BF0688
MQSFDLVILGGGMVGLSLALALADTSLQIAVVDPHLPAPLDAERDFSLRVSAISASSQHFLDALGAWSGILSQRLQSYQTMHVWEKDSFAKIDFDCQSVMTHELGHIIENDVIRDSLWQLIQSQSNVTILSENCLQIERGQREAWLRFEQAGMVSAQLIVGADGANSWLREQCHVPLTFWDYQHHALVATIRTQLPHQNCARQIFTPQGPLAFLPLPDPHCCSIVWSVPLARAEQLQAFSVEQFNRELAMAFDQQLGLCERVGELGVFPLRMRYARDMAGDRFVLIGDAAHTIHPLAGQGVNLGLTDARDLATTLRRLHEQGKDLGLHPHLRDWERQRKGDATLMIGAMEFFKRLFSGQHPAKKLLRGLGMELSNQLPMLKQRWIKQALGLGEPRI